MPETNQSVLHFIGGAQLAVVQTADEVINTVADEPNFSDGTFAFHTLSTRLAASVANVYVNWATVTHVVPDG